jgi:methyl-accepting chemotaxis protein
VSSNTFTKIDDGQLKIRSQLSGLLFFFAVTTIISILILAGRVIEISKADSSWLLWSLPWAAFGIVSVIVAVHLVVARLLNRLTQLSTSVSTVVEGNLIGDSQSNSSDEVAHIGRQLDRLAANLSITVANIRSSASVVAETGTSLADASNELSSRTSQQAAALEETAASILEITETVQQSSQNAAQASNLADKVSDTARGGEQAMRRAVESMTGIQTGAQRMSDIVSVIDEIAFQTNILALNASVEAARAGEQGKSFAVVASEVSTLAHRSAQAAREIKALIAASTDQISEGVVRVNAVAQALQSILGGVQKVAAQVGEISSATAEQSKGLSQISSAITELDSITQQNSLLVEQSATAAAELSERAARISQWVQRFRLRQGTAEEAMELVHRALDYIKDHGMQAAITAINDPKMRFYDRDMYVFINDNDCRFHAFGGKPERIGSSALDMPGVDAKKLRDLTLQCVERGGGWFEYEIPNPVTGVLEPKMSYLMPIGNGLNVACGVYRTEMMSAD